MTQLRFLILILLIGGLNIVYAQNNSISLFTWDSENGLAEESTFTGFEKAFPVKIAVPYVRGKRTLPNTFTLPTPGGQQLSVQLEIDTKNQYKDLVVWNGLAPDARFDHLPQYKNIVVVYNRETDKFAAYFMLPEGEFQLLPTTNSSRDYWLIQGSNDWKCRTLEADEIPPSQASLREGEDCDCLETDQNGDFPIDIFMGYSNSAAATAGDINAHAAMMVASVNQGLTNSLVDNVFLRLVGTGETANNPGVVTSVLSDCRIWFADEIKALGPDYIGVFQTPTGAPGSAGGWAGVGGSTSVNSINSPNAFRHEIGHNGGGGHCPGDGSTLPYAHGFDNGNWRTHLCGNDVNFYSTPLVDDDLGNPIGDAVTADMAQAFRDRAPNIIYGNRHRVPYFAGDICATFPCFPQHFAGQNEFINQVTINTIDNATGGWECDNTTGYSDYVALSTDVEIGVAYPLTVTPNFSFSNSRFNVWVDWDGDGEFQNDEYLINLTGTGPWTGNITPPVGTSLGNKRLRIRLQFGANYTPDPCNGSGFNGGETEDYTLNVIAALPVELTDFRASCDQEKLSLDWITNSEINNHGFEIQESEEGRVWKKLGWQPALGSGNSVVPLAYHFTWPDTGGSYLRLKQIDKDGAFSFSPMIANPCSENSADGEFIVYPNPLKDWLIIERTLEDPSEMLFQIFSPSGQLVSQEYFDQSFTRWDAQALVNGVYFYKIIKNGQPVKQGKFVKIK